METVAAIRDSGHKTIRFSQQGEQADRDIKQFLMPHMYRQKDVLRVRHQAEGLVRDLFDAYINNPDNLPEEWSIRVKSGDEKARAREISDYIAGMTDRYAMREHQRLFAVREL